MTITFTKFGRSQLPLIYDDNELLAIIESFINQSHGIFNYTQMYEYVKSFALQNDGFKVEPYTRYSEIILTGFDEHRLSQILWNKIWQKKIMIEFHRYGCSQNSDMFFSVVK